MKSAIFFSILPTLLSTLVAAQDGFTGAGAAYKRIAAATHVPNRFIIEVEDLSVLNSNGRREFAHPLDAVYHEFKARDIKVSVSKEYKVDGIFTGAALTINSTQDVAAIESIPGIKAIRPIRIFQRPKLPKWHVVNGPKDPEIPPDTYFTHILGGVDKVHAEGNIGKGIKIGVIDTGVDYNHPTLGSNGIGAGKKIVTGYDFAGDKFTPTNPVAAPDSDPMDCDGHGTHVMGIIAAQPGNLYNITGVAYGATFAAYKVFGCKGGTTEDIIVDGLLQGHKDGMDILTLSLGSDDGWATSSSAVIANNLGAAGTVLTIAAGNAGSSGSWYTGSPAASDNVISIGSVDNTIIALQNATVNGVAHNPITYFSGLPLPINGSLPVYATSKSTNITNDACAPLPADTPDLSPYLVVIRRGTCHFSDKLENARVKGAQAVFIYDNGNGFAPIDTGDFKVAALIQAEDGEFLVQQFAAGANLTVSFPQTGAATGLADPHGGLMSDYSSYGPSFDFKFKPAVSAPGGNIMSTLPLSQGGYGVLSGTSMATPYAAGSAALYLAAKGKVFNAGNVLKTIFETTSNKIATDQDDSGAFETLTKTGAGLLNVYKAIHAETILSTGEFILNDTAHFVKTHKFSVQNKGKTPKRYTLTHVPALTALTMKENTLYPAIGPVPTVPTPAKASIFPSSFTVFPGGRQDVIVSFTPPSIDKVRYPVYSGFIDVASGSESTHVSYIGLVGNLKDHPIIDTTTALVKIAPPAILDKNAEKQATPTNYTFTTVDYPTVLYRLLMGSPSFHIDLVDANINFKPTIQSRQFGGFWPWFTFPHQSPGGTFARVKIIGLLYGKEYIPRNDERTSDDPEENTAFYTFDLKKPKFANGTVIANGQYRFLMRALRLTGNPQAEEDYESWLSPIIGINYYNATTS